MYTPGHFRIDDIGACTDLIAANPFGLLVSDGGDDGFPQASHLPFHLARDAAGKPELQCHLARANPQAAALDGARVRCIFQGPHSYVSPTWYGRADTVPTWNYVAVHCLGTAERIDDLAQLSGQMRELAEGYETGEDWRFDGMCDGFLSKNLKAIAGFRIRISEVIGKAKLSQNRSAEDVDNLVAGLKATGRAEDEAVATLMEQAYRARKGGK